MSQVIEGRDRHVHRDIIAQLLMRTDLNKFEQFDLVMEHVRMLEAERDAFERQLDYIITGE